jgi:hypothetical protein
MYLAVIHTKKAWTEKAFRHAASGTEHMLFDTNAGTDVIASCV